MKKKQITALLLSALLIFGCSACAGNTNESSASSETSVSSAKPTPTEEPDVVPEDGVMSMMIFSPWRSAMGLNVSI